MSIKGYLSSLNLATNPLSLMIHLYIPYQRIENATTYQINVLFRNLFSEKLPSIKPIISVLKVYECGVMNFPPHVEGNDRINMVWTA